MVQDYPIREPDRVSGRSQAESKQICQSTCMSFNESNWLQMGVRLQAIMHSLRVFNLLCEDNPAVPYGGD